MKVSDLQRHLKMENTRWGKDVELSSPIQFCPVTASEPGSVAFIDDPRFGGGSALRKPLAPIDVIEGAVDSIMEDEIYCAVVASKASVLLVPDWYVSHLSLKAFDPPVDYDKTLLLVSNPRLAYINLMHHFFPQPASIDHSALVYDCVELGENVFIGPGSVIGEDGFGFWRKSNGKVVRFPQIGGVVIGDDVTIQANVCIDRGALGDTVIGSGTKMDNLVHISHNCKIGEDCLITAHATIGGSAVLGDRCWVGLSATVSNNIKVGNDCVVGLGAVVIKDVPDNHTAVGVPAVNKERV